LIHFEPRQKPCQGIAVLKKELEKVPTLMAAGSPFDSGAKTNHPTKWAAEHSNIFQHKRFAAKSCGVLYI